jgi:hypothetical protein
LRQKQVLHKAIGEVFAVASFRGEMLSPLKYFNSARGSRLAMVIQLAVYVLETYCLRAAR